jgi:hypothetical protein
MSGQYKTREEFIKLEELIEQDVIDISAVPVSFATTLGVPLMLRLLVHQTALFMDIAGTLRVMADTLTIIAERVRRNS